MPRRPGLSQGLTHQAVGFVGSSRGLAATLERSRQIASEQLKARLVGGEIELTRERTGREGDGDNRVAVMGDVGPSPKSESHALARKTCQLELAVEVVGVQPVHRSLEPICQCLSKAREFLRTQPERIDFHDEVVRVVPIPVLASQTNRCFKSRLSRVRDASFELQRQLRLTVV